MSWNSGRAQLTPSTIRQLLPLLVTLVLVGVVGWVCYQIYVSLAKIKAQARKQMGDNVVFSRDGVRVNMQHVGEESYLDATQSWVVKAWNLGTGENDETVRRKRNFLTRHKSRANRD